MREFMRQTWFPTVAFTIATVPLYGDYSEFGPILAIGQSIVALCLVPLLWRAYVLRAGRPGMRRSALAGAASGFLIVLLPHLVAAILFAATRRSGLSDGLGEFAGLFADVFFVGIALLIAAPIGATLGVATSLIAGAGQVHTVEPTRVVASPSHRALQACMICLLLSPVVGPSLLIALAALFEPLKWVAPRSLIQAIGLSWVILLPVAAAIGSRRSAMVEQLRRVRLPLLAMLVPALAIGSIWGGRWATYAAGTCILLTLRLWPGRWTVGDASIVRAGITAGAWIGGLTLLAPVFIAALWIITVGIFAPGRARPDELLPLGRIALGSLLASTIGAAIGGLLARKVSRPAQSGRSSPAWRVEGTH